MEESTLKKLAVLCSIIGLVLLYYASIRIQECSDIYKITALDIGKSYRICGNITSVKVSNNHVFFDIKDKTDKIKFVIFNSSALKLNDSGTSPYDLKGGTQISASGIVDEYPKGTGELELVYRGGNIEVY
jgi:aspartyl/asparaginyl-tRNA synthetase